MYVIGIIDTRYECHTYRDGKKNSLALVRERNIHETI